MMNTRGEHPISYIGVCYANTPTPLKTLCNVIFGAQNRKIHGFWKIHGVELKKLGVQFLPPTPKKAVPSDRRGEGGGGGLRGQNSKSHWAIIWSPKMMI